MGPVDIIILGAVAAAFVAVVLHVRKKGTCGDCSAGAIGRAAGLPCVRGRRQGHRAALRRDAPAFLTLAPGPTLPMRGEFRNGHSAMSGRPFSRAAGDGGVEARRPLRPGNHAETKIWNNRSVTI